MNKRLAGVLIFAFVVSAAASLVLYRLISARIAAQAQPAKAQVVVAARDLAIGTLIKDLDVKVVEWSGAIPAQAVLKPEDAVNRGVVSPIYAGEPLLESRLAAKGGGAGLAATIPQGKRAVAIPVNDITGVAGFVTPGMRVDVLMMGRPPNASAAVGTQTKTLLQNMEVLSAGQQIQKDAEGKPISVPVLNLLVTPEEAEVLSLASSDARIRLVLRNPLDNEKSTPPGTAMARLWSGNAQAPPSASPKPRIARAQLAPAPRVEVQTVRIPIIVEVFHGSTKKETKFAEKNSEEKQ
jgi:pilus assembly protein CpaB